MLTKSSSNTFHGRNISREPRHFVPLKNTPGELIKLDKKELHIDQKYQRKINQAVIHRIANNWSWIACGVLLVSLRSDGSGHFIVDGQHRWEAAKLLNNVKELPCLVFELNKIEDEAIGFLAANTERRILKIEDQFNALLLTDDPVAKTVEQLARQAGRHIGKPSDKTHIACVGALMRAVRIDQQAIERVWPIISRLTQDQPLSGMLVTGIFSLERRMPKNHSLSELRWSDRLRSIGSEALLHSIKAMSGIEGKSNERVWGQGIFRALNKGMRNPLHIDFNQRIQNG